MPTCLYFNSGTIVGTIVAQLLYKPQDTFEKINSNLGLDDELVIGRRHLIGLGPRLLQLLILRCQLQFQIRVVTLKLLVPDIRVTQITRITLQ